MYSCVLSCSFFCVLCSRVVLCALPALFLCVCPVVRPVPCLPCLWCGCVVLWLWCVGAVRPAPALPAPVGVCYGVPCTPCTFPVFFSGDNTCPIYGVLYVGLVRSLYTCPIFRLAIYDPFCTYNKKPAHGFRIWISKSRLEFSMFCFFLFAEFSPVKFPA